MGSSSSRNVENSSSPGSQRCRRDSCFFGRRHHHHHQNDHHAPEIKSAGASSSSSSPQEERQEGSAAEYKRIAGGIILDRYSPGGTSTTAEISLLPSECQSPSSSAEDDAAASESSSDEDEPKVDEVVGDVEVTAGSSGDGSTTGSGVELNLFDRAEAQVETPTTSATTPTTTTSSSSSRLQVAAEEQLSSLRVGESRRNSGRRFWDALTRAATHRRNSTPITIVAIEEIDDNGSSTSRWNFQHWRASLDADQSTASRIANLEDRRRHVRSHVYALQRLSGGLQVSRAHSRSCPATSTNGGSCSCEASTASEDSSTRASISRIIMLAEALFEVLDEIHRQSVALSRSAAMPLSSQPAPDEVVDSIPIRLFKKSDVLEEAAQCHICLIEYEEDDEIRVLPCQHEYHKNCVDKWLKEVHRVCPLCRGDVCGSESTASTNLEVPSS